MPYDSATGLWCDPEPKKPVLFAAGIDSTPQECGYFVELLLVEEATVYLLDSDGGVHPYKLSGGDSGGINSQCGGVVDTITYNHLQQANRDDLITDVDELTTQYGFYGDEMAYGIQVISIGGPSELVVRELEDVLVRGCEWKAQHTTPLSMDTCYDSCATHRGNERLISLHFQIDPDYKSEEAYDEDIDSSRYLWDEYKQQLKDVYLYAHHHHNPMGGVDMVYWNYSEESPMDGEMSMEDKLYRDIAYAATRRHAIITTNTGFPGRQTYKVMSFVRDNIKRFNNDGFAVLLPRYMASNPNESHHDIDSVVIVQSRDFAEAS
jgi:hypothetical protein